MTAISSDHGDLLGFDASCLTRESIHDRYAELIAAKKERDDDAFTGLPIGDASGDGSVQPLLL